MSQHRSSGGDPISATVPPPTHRTRPHVRARVSFAFRLAVLALVILSTACASLPRRDPLEIDVAGIEPLSGEGMELRLAVKLRVQNPNDTAIDYRGAALQLSFNGRRLATGVSDASGTVPRYGEAVLTVPVTVSALDMARQIAALADAGDAPAWHYRIEGKLEGGLFGTRRFGDSGTLDLSQGLDLSRQPGGPRGR